MSRIILFEVANIDEFIIRQNLKYKLIVSVWSIKDNSHGNWDITVDEIITQVVTERLNYHARYN